jgi:hypothetical protein
MDFRVHPFTTARPRRNHIVWYLIPLLTLLMLFGAVALPGCGTEDEPTTPAGAHHAQDSDTP